MRSLPRVLAAACVVVALGIASPVTADTGDAVTVTTNLQTARGQSTGAKAADSMEAYKNASENSATIEFAGYTKATGSVIKPGQRMVPGQTLTSANGKHKLKLSKNGKLTLISHGKLRWTAKAKAPAGTSLVMTKDGNLVLQKGTKVYWKTGTQGKSVARARITNDGDLVLTTTKGKSAWTLSKRATTRINRGTVPYYSQTDSRWGNIWYGNYRFKGTGCVPTSFAMVAQSYGVNVTPKSAGDYLYKIGELNGKHGVGTRGVGVTKLANYYGLKVTPLKSQSEIKKALQQKRPVIAALAGPASITSPAYTHAVVLTDYQDGKVTVRNPLGASSKKYLLSTLWTNRSRDKMDIDSGAVFWAIG